MNQKEINKFCAYMLQEYGWTMSSSNELLPIYYSLHQSKITIDKSSDELKKQVKEVLSSLKVKQYQFSNAEAAKGWWNGKIKHTLIIIFFLALIIVAGYFFYKACEEERLYQNFMKVIKIEKTESGETYFTIFVPHKKNTFLTGYEFIRSDSRPIAVRVFFNNTK